MDAPAWLSAAEPSKRSNPLGTAIFLGYIAGALVTSISIIRKLFIIHECSHKARVIRQGHDNHSSEEEAPSAANTASSSRDVKIKHADAYIRQRKLKLLVASSAISFSALSTTMISFLVSSFQKYDERYGPRGIAQTAQLPTRIWDWMLHSSLFQHFANDLVSTRMAAWWTCLALLISMHTTVWVADKCELGSISRFQNIRGGRGAMI